jgi:putative membrane protein
MLRVALAALHLFALAIGFGAVLRRSAALREPATANSVRRALRADIDWGIAAGLWIVTGLWRWLGGMEKEAGYYIHNSAFMGKMGVLILILALEVMPIIALTKWRSAISKGAAPESVGSGPQARLIATLSSLQAVLVVIMVILAASMARGMGS